MGADQLHELLTPDEETRWLRSIAAHLLEAHLSLEPLTRSEILDRLATVLAASRSQLPSGET